jgi:DNA-binding response OmpR family regulator
MHVLIAEDDPVYRALLEELLSSWGYDVVKADDGQQAWEAIQSRDDIQIAVLDWLMPELDGYEVCRRIRQDSRRQGLYTILVTGHRERDEIVKVLVAGADDYILKPFEPLDLKIRLRVAMRVINLEAELAELRRSLKPAVA